VQEFLSNMQWDEADLNMIIGACTYPRREHTPPSPSCRSGPYMGYQTTPLRRMPDITPTFFGIIPIDPRGVLP
jgi:hypothetical protein